MTKPDHNPDGTPGAVQGNGKTSLSDGDDAPKKPEAPLGNMPPGSRWPVAVLGLVWLGWVGFLFAMMLSRGSASAG